MRIATQQVTSEPGAADSNSWPRPIFFTPIARLSEDLSEVDGSELEVPLQFLCSALHPKYGCF